MAPNFYTEDLTYVHDVGFRNYVLQAMPGVLDILRKNQIDSGLIVDLGCGTGLSSQHLVEANYSVLGVDVSESMIAIAKQRVPTAQFRIASVYETEIPPCQAVISIGECFNYCFGSVINHDQKLEQLFRQLYTAMMPGGVLIFDGVEPGQVTPGAAKSFTEAEDWFVLVDKQEDETVLTRRIITFRQVQADQYRRSTEIHRQRLFDRTTLTQTLTDIGFQVAISTHYGAFQLPIARIACIAQKPATG